MTKRKQSSSIGNAVAMVIEPLENRQLMAADWGAVPKLVRQDDAATRFPSITGAGQSVALIDTGIDYNLSYLGGGFGAGHKVVGGFDFVDNDADPMDTFGHGTNVAGIIAANPYEFEGAKYQGIAPGANLVALRVDSADQPVPATRIRTALQWVIDHQAEFNICAVNISFGEGNYAGDQTSLYSTQLKNLQNMGVFVAGASGNAGVQSPAGVQYPAADPSVVSVGAVDAFDRITEWSSRSAGLDYLAPGENIVTTSEGPNNFEKVSGTSFSTPMISGAVALLKQANPDLDTFDVRSILRNSGSSNKDGDTEFGTTTGLTFPRLDVSAAVALANSWKVGSFADTGVFAASTNSSIAYDHDGVLHSVYYDPKAQTLMYAVRLHGHKLSAPQRVDPAAAITGIYSSLQIDSKGRPGVAYFDGTHGDLRYAHWSGSRWDVHSIEGLGSVGLYPSLVFDANDNPYISYYHKTNGNLKLANWNGTGWSTMNLDSKGNVGRSTSIARSSTGELAIAYEHSGLGLLKVARDGGNGKWSLALADPVAGGIGFTDIAFNNSNQPAVSYYNAKRSDLKYAKFDGTNWTQQTLSSKGATGLYPKLYFDKSGKTNILFYNRRTNNLQQVTGDIPDWTASVLQSAGGQFISIAPTADNSTLTYTWFRNSDGKLVFADTAIA